MPRANVLARDAGRVAGTGTAPRRLVDLIDAEFLAGIGYAAAAMVRRSPLASAAW